MSLATWSGSSSWEEVAAVWEGGELGFGVVVF